MMKKFRQKSNYVRTHKIITKQQNIRKTNTIQYLLNSKHLKDIKHTSSATFTHSLTFSSKNRTVFGRKRDRIYREDTDKERERL